MRHTFGERGVYGERVGDVEIIYVEDRPARLPHDPLARRMWGEPEQVGHWHPVVWYGGVQIEVIWMLMPRDGWCWTDRGRIT